MAHIEFLGDRDPARPGDAPVETLDVEPPRVSPRWRDRLAIARVMVPALLAVAAIVLVMVAPWQRLFELSDLFDGVRATTVGTDGWGRFFASDRPAEQHLPRFGIVLYVAAGLLLAGAGLRVLAALRGRPRWEQVGSWTVGAAIGVLGGTLASAALEADTYFDVINAQRAAEESGGAHLDGFDNGIHLGAMLFLGFGGMSVAVLALVAPVVLDRLLRPQTEAQTPASPPPSDPLAIPPVAAEPAQSALIITGEPYRAGFESTRLDDETLD